ncbi:hypothetical protein HK096_002114 [Nowakowskiella sp. JEL0078]|nr:hypothetical protein HK096_002114 [Nowakowskiella sp. JEL0078]
MRKIIFKSRSDITEVESDNKKYFEKTFLDHLLPYAEKVNLFVLVVYEGGIDRSSLDDYRSFLRGQMDENNFYNIEVFNDKYNYFTNTQNQVEERSCYLILSRRRVEFLGKLDLKDLPLAKKMKYSGFLFKSYTPIFTLEKVNLKVNDDISINNYNFTDGCGLVSEDIANEMMDKHLTKQRQQDCFRATSLMQIRLPGVKGVLLVDNSLEKKTIILRKSMCKLKVLNLLRKKNSDPPNLLLENLPFHVLDFAKPVSFSYLNYQSMALFVQRGIPVDIFKTKSRDYINAVRYMTVLPLMAVNFLWIKGEYLFLKKFLYCINELISASESFNARNYSTTNNFREEIWSKLVNMQKSEMEQWKKKSRVPVQSSREQSAKEPAYRLQLPVRGIVLFGAADPSSNSVLKPGQCFVKVSNGKKNPITITGKVSVFRYPCYHPGDIRILEAVDCSDLENFVNVILFPVEGNRPIADEMGGGDLDGDKFHIIWDQDIIPIKECEAFNYSADKMKKIISDKAKFFSRSRTSRYNKKKNDKIEEINFLTSDHQSNHIASADRLMHIWQQFKHPSLQNSNMEDVLVSLFNVGVDKEAGLPDIPSLIESLEREIRADSSSLSEFGKLDNWIFTEMQSCVEGVQKSEKNSGLMWESFHSESINSLKKLKTLINSDKILKGRDSVNTDKILNVHKFKMIPPDFRMLASHMPVPFEPHDDIKIALRVFHLINQQIKMNHDIEESNWISDDLKKQLVSIFGTQLVSQCIKVLEKIDLQLKNPSLKIEGQDKILELAKIACQIRNEENDLKKLKEIKETLNQFYIDKMQNVSNLEFPNILEISTEYGIKSKEEKSLKELSENLKRNFFPLRVNAKIFEKYEPLFTEHQEYEESRKSLESLKSQSKAFEKNNQSDYQIEELELFRSRSMDSKKDFQNLFTEIAMVSSEYKSLEVQIEKNRPNFFSTILDFFGGKLEEKNIYFSELTSQSERTKEKFDTLMIAYMDQRKNILSDIDKKILILESKIKQFQTNLQYFQIMLQDCLSQEMNMRHILRQKFDFAKNKLIYSNNFEIDKIEQKNKDNLKKFKENLDINEKKLEEHRMITLARQKLLDRADRFVYVLKRVVNFIRNHDSSKHSAAVVVKQLKNVVTFEIGFMEMVDKIPVYDKKYIILQAIYGNTLPDVLGSSCLIKDSKDITRIVVLVSETGSGILNCIFFPP